MTANKDYTVSNSRNNRGRRLVRMMYALGQRRCYCGVQLVYQPGQPNSATFEHLVPKSAGGTYHPINGIVACQRCNNQRGNTCWLKWLEQKQPPKKEWLEKKYLEAVAYYDAQGRKLKIRYTPTVKIYIENLTINA